MPLYEVTGVVEYAKVVHCEVEAANMKEAKEIAAQKWNDESPEGFPEFVSMIVDKPIKVKP